MCKESERTYTVVERYQHNILVSPLLTVKLRLRSPALAHAAAEYPDGNRQFGIGLTRFLGPYVKIEAVLAVGSLIAVTPLSCVAAGIMGCLEWRMTELVTKFDTFPWNHWLRSLPAVLTRRRCCKRNSAVNGNSLDIGSNALYLSTLNSQDGAVILSAACHKSQHAGQSKKQFLHKAFGLMT